LEIEFRQRTTEIMSIRNPDVRPALPKESIATCPDAEVLLLTAFRCWLAGYETSDIACWEVAWQGVSRDRPAAQAKRIIAEVSQFTRIFRQTLRQQFVHLPYCCSRITSDECALLHMVACAQHGELIRAEHLAHKLSNNPHYFELVDAASDLGRALSEASLSLTYTDASKLASRNGDRFH
jgi:hypothetical protein